MISISIPRLRRAVSVGVGGLFVCPAGFSGRAPLSDDMREPGADDQRQGHQTALLVGCIKMEPLSQRGKIDLMNSVKR
jgi:hypothetical protein